MTANTATTTVARARGENFPVAMRLLGPTLRGRLLAVYGVARLIDDTGDELEGDREAALDVLDAELDAALFGRATIPAVVRLSPVLRRLDCGVAPFHDLVAANRLDQRVTRYATFDDLRGYCELSAVPVGRIVLSLLDASSPQRAAQSDDVCVALQLVEHLQDVGEDAARGRVYLPQEDLAHFGCEESDLTGRMASPALRRVVAHESHRARELLAPAVPLAASLGLRGRLAVAGFAGGGHAALDAIELADHDVLRIACRPRRRRLARRMLEVLLATRRPAWS